MSAKFIARRFTETVDGLRPNVDRKLTWSFRINEEEFNLTLEVPQVGESLLLTLNDQTIDEVCLPKTRSQYSLSVSGQQLVFHRQAGHIHLEVEGTDFDELYQKLVFKAESRKSAQPLCESNAKRLPEQEIFPSKKIAQRAPEFPGETSNSQATI